MDSLQDDLLRALKKDHPEWSEEDVSKRAEQWTTCVQEPILPELKQLLASGTCNNIAVNGLLLGTIRHLYGGCSLLDALWYANDYLKTGSFVFQGTTISDQVRG